MNAAEWFVRAPLRVDPVSGRHVLEIRALDHQCREAVVCSVPLRRQLSEQGVIATLAEYFGDFDWRWMAEETRFVGRRMST